MDQFKEAGEFGLRKIGTMRSFLQSNSIVCCIALNSYLILKYNLGIRRKSMQKTFFCILDMLAKALYYTFHLNRQNKSNVPKSYLPLPTIFKKQTTNMYSGVF